MHTHTGKQNARVMRGCHWRAPGGTWQHGRTLDAASFMLTSSRSNRDHSRCSAVYSGRSRPSGVDRSPEQTQPIAANAHTTPNTRPCSQHEVPYGRAGAQGKLVAARHTQCIVIAIRAAQPAEPLPVTQRELSTRAFDAKA